ncbi:uncharacterized protein OCT59_014596 [Rhizophagus irregularis]|uniref:Uncharacterized protein n=3 Tax=Rhizophagus irregularis TaxID=588596 RepID=A0A015M4A7_RHIIW|nr:hypothetical protein RirG_040520 [Rhizophagus irregularis DAOM 197198w]UZO22228.1 hypothetical protein OCT59_014596 [Rhizophagus irregularis]GBC44278.2 hypothetical protein GLOIN_2v1761319 [Rhizophagus irregularis DAOM 181602=DAOM 197198]EXX79821.1 hypothetical protein RirG_001930 [Rhizophagus irregularis DAOM 197198w]CAB4382697.1 unnamed protein product [Rhizophagus irregularis]
MSSRLFIKLLNISPKYTSTYPIFSSRINSFKPTFLVKRPYSSDMYLSSSNTPNEESTLKKYSPYIYSYFIWVTFGSMLLHLKWSKMNHIEYKEKMQLKISKLEETIDILENGEKINNNLLRTKHTDDELHNKSELDKQKDTITEGFQTTKSSIKWI